MSRATTREELDKLRSARDELLRLSEFLHLPNYDGLEFVEKALPLGNSQSTTEEKAKAYFLANFGVLLDRATTLNDTKSAQPSVDDAIGTIDTDHEMDIRVNLFWSDVRELRIEFRRALELILTSRKDAEKELGDFISAALDEFVLVPTITWNGSKTQIQIKYCPLSTRAVLGHALMLLLDKQKGIGKHLRKCKLNSCERVFISQASSKGGRRPLFCTDNHRKEAASQTGAKRTRKYRKKLNERLRAERITK